MADSPEVLEKLEALRAAVDHFRDRSTWDSVADVFAKLMDFLDTVAESNRDVAR